MIRVTLAYQYKHHKPDETVNLADAVARRLLHDGLARLAPPSKLPAVVPVEVPTPTTKSRSGGRKDREKS